MLPLRPGALRCTPIARALQYFRRHDHPQASRQRRGRDGRPRTTVKINAFRWSSSSFPRSSLCCWLRPSSASCAAWQPSANASDRGVCPSYCRSEQLQQFDGGRREAAGDAGVGVDAAVAQEGPVLASGLDQGGVEIGDEDLFLVRRSLREYRAQTRSAIKLHLPRTRRVQTRVCGRPDPGWSRHCEPRRRAHGQLD